MGHATYALSRIRQDASCPENEGRCGNDTEKDRMPRVARGYLDEIRDLRDWRYPELGLNYQFRLAPSVAVDPEQPVSLDGRMLSTASFQRLPGSPEALRTAAATRRLELYYCLADTPADPCGSGDDFAAKTQHITGLRRGPRPGG